MLDYQDLVHAQLTFLAQRDMVSFNRAVQALKGLRTNGTDSSYCFLAFYANEDTCTDELQRSLAYSDIKEVCKEFMIPSHCITALEWIIISCGLDEPLDKEQQAFLKLCKEVQNVCSPQATGSEG